MYLYIPRGQKHAIGFLLFHCTYNTTYYLQYPMPQNKKKYGIQIGTTSNVQRTLTPLMLDNRFMMDICSADFKSKGRCVYQIICIYAKIYYVIFGKLKSNKNSHFTHTCLGDVFWFFMLMIGHVRESRDD